MNKFLLSVEANWLLIGLVSSVPISFYEAGRLVGDRDPIPALSFASFGATLGAFGGPLTLPAYLSFKIGQCRHRHY